MLKTQKPENYCSSDQPDYLAWFQRCDELQLNDNLLNHQIKKKNIHSSNFISKQPAGIQEMNESGNDFEIEI